MKKQSKKTAKEATPKGAKQSALLPLKGVKVKKTLPLKFKSNRTQLVTKNRSGNIMVITSVRMEEDLLLQAQNIIKQVQAKDGNTKVNIGIICTDAIRKFVTNYNSSHRKLPLKEMGTVSKKVVSKKTTVGAPASKKPKAISTLAVEVPA